MTGTLWLRCEIPDGPRQARRVSEAREVAQELCGDHGHASIEVAAGRVFCDLYYSGPQSLSYLATTLHFATGERFRLERSFPSTVPRRAAVVGNAAG